MKSLIVFFILISLTIHLHAEDGHNLWFRYKSNRLINVVSKIKSPTLDIAKQELENGWQGKDKASIALTIVKDEAILGDGFKLSPNSVRAKTELGILYGVYELLRLQQMVQTIQEEIFNPSYERRLLNHWDNPDGSIERGYAGLSIFWRNEKDSLTITEKDKILWHEYARANASINIFSNSADYRFRTISSVPCMS